MRSLSQERDPSLEDEPLGAAAEPGPERAHERLVRAAGGGRTTGRSSARPARRRTRGPGLRPCRSSELQGFRACITPAASRSAKPAPHDAPGTTMTEPARLRRDRTVGATSTTPAGFQSMAALRRRRRFVAGVNRRHLSRPLAAWMAAIARRRRLERGRRRPVRLLPGRRALDGARLLERRSSASGCCTAARDGMDEVAPFAARRRATRTPLRVRTAILMTLRNEDPAPRLRAAARGQAQPRRDRVRRVFRLFHPERHQRSGRRRGRGGGGRGLAPRACRTPRASSIAAASDNTGFKAGNVRDFCERWGSEYELHAAARRRQPDVGRRRSCGWRA